MLLFLSFCVLYVYRLYIRHGIRTLYRSCSFIVTASIKDFLVVFCTAWHVPKMSNSLDCSSFTIKVSLILINFYFCCTRTFSMTVHPKCISKATNPHFSTFCRPVNDLVTYAPIRTYMGSDIKISESFSSFKHSLFLTEANSVQLADPKLYEGTRIFYIQIY